MTVKECPKDCGGHAIKNRSVAGKSEDTSGRAQVIFCLNKRAKEGQPWWVKDGEGREKKTAVSDRGVIGKNLVLDANRTGPERQRGTGRVRLRSMTKVDNGKKGSQ